MVQPSCQIGKLLGIVSVDVNNWLKFRYICVIQDEVTLTR